MFGQSEFVPQSQPDSLMETGIGQDPETGGISLQWYTVTNAAGYKIYRSETANLQGVPISFTLVGNVISSRDFGDTSMVDVNAKKTGIPYYYYFRPYSSDGTLGSSSDTISYELLNRPGIRYPVYGDSLAKTAVYFTWGNASGGGNTVIRVVDLSVLPYETAWVSNRFTAYDNYPTRYFNFDGTARLPLVVGHSYRWRVMRFEVDGTGRPYEGSTSIWSEFKVK